MIIDSSALIAIIFDEPHLEQFLRAIETEDSICIPAPVLTETHLVIAGRGQRHLDAAKLLIEMVMNRGAEVAPFERRHAEITLTARERYGKGNGSGGLLNFGDLMVYAVAKDRNEALLFTGRDFASTDLQFHPASRLEP